MNPLQAAFDLWLKDAPEVRADCAALAGRVIAVEATDLGIELCLRPNADGVAVTLEDVDAPDVRVAATGADLLRMVRGTRAAPPHLTITGDAELAQRVRALFRRVRFDPTERLAAVVGDVPAHQLGRALRGLAAFGRETVGTLSGMAGEYLQFETRTLPTRSEVAAFIADVDRLRDDVERAAAHLEIAARRRA